MPSSIPEKLNMCNVSSYHFFYDNAVFTSGSEIVEQGLVKGGFDRRYNGTRAKMLTITGRFLISEKDYFTGMINDLTAGEPFNVQAHQISVSNVILFHSELTLNDKYIGKFKFIFKELTA